MKTRGVQLPDIPGKYLHNNIIILKTADTGQNITNTARLMLQADAAGIQGCHAVLSATCAFLLDSHHQLQ